MKIEVIRCKDCKFFHPDEVGYCEIPLCERMTFKHTGKIGDIVFGVDRDDFCSFAERKE